LLFAAVKTKLLKQCTLALVGTDPCDLGLILTTLLKALGKTLGTVDWVTGMTYSLQKPVPVSEMAFPWNKEKINGEPANSSSPKIWPLKRKLMLSCSIKSGQTKALKQEVHKINKSLHQCAFQQFIFHKC